ncbi:MAG: MFS transporter [Desulfovibrio sp.]|nr:MFS transporter [Desulfovibrio sp.]MBI4959732.1 MFS transporter [Desulfovibrio sp.]
MLLASAAVSKSPLFRSLRHPNYKLYFCGQLVSLTGTWMQSTAQGWLVYRITGSSLALGVVGFAAMIPILLFGLFGGVLADRFPKRSLLVWAQALALVQATALCLLTLSGHIEVWHIVLCAAFLGLVNALEIPTRHSFVVEMVGKEDLHNAIALNSSIFHLARVVGPTLAGLLVGWVGEGWCFGLNAVSFLAVIASLLAMRLELATVARREAGVREHLMEGIRYAWSTPLVRSILLLISMASLLGASGIVLLPAFAGDVFKAGPQGLGYLTASSGAGSIAGALYMASRGEAKGLRSLAMWGCAGLGAALVLFAQAPHYWIAVALIAPSGFCLMVLMPSCNTMLQLAAPDGMRGRVMSLYTMLYMGVAPFGALLAGSLAQWLGAPLAVTILGAGCLIGALGPGRSIHKA